MATGLARLTVMANGAVWTSSSDEETNELSLASLPDGSVLEVVAEPARGTRVLSVRQGTDIDTVTLVDGPTLYAHRAADNMGGPWVDVTKHVQLHGGQPADVSISTDATGHQWETGKAPQWSDGRGVYPARDWLKITHPPNDTLHPSSHAGGESIELGRDRYTRSNGTRFDTNYTHVERHERDAMGRDTVVHTHWSYEPATGGEHNWSSVTASDGTKSWTTVSRQGDSWTMTTVTVDGNGVGTKHTTKGEGNKITKDETKPADRDDKPPSGDDESGGSDNDNGNGNGNGNGNDDTDDRGNDGTNRDGAPTGDGDSGREGNPDAGVPFDAVKLAGKLVGDWDSELDTLGDLEGQLRPWIDRIVAAAKQGGGGHHEEHDTLGAPPILKIDLTGYTDDELEDFDSLGRPRPIFSSLIEVAFAAGEHRTARLGKLETAGVNFAQAADRVAVAKGLDLTTRLDLTATENLATDVETG